MKTKTPKTHTSNSPSSSHSSKPFINKSGEGAFFSNAKETEQPFFSQSIVQTKLTIGQPNDKYEQEADQVADQVVQRLEQSKTVDSNQESSSISKNPLSISSIQRKCDACDQEEKLQKKEDELGEMEVMRKPIFESNGDPPDGQIQTKSNRLNFTTSSLESRLNASKGKGSPLPKESRNEMESAFDADFGQVKVHTDSNSVKMNRELNGKAFTDGSDIFFNKGEFSTNSKAGKKLLAHELTHVVQQKGRIDHIQKQPITTPAKSNPQPVNLPPKQIREAIRFNNSRYREKDIKLIQNIVGDSETGVINEGTIKLIVVYQKEHNHKPDGKVGKDTFFELTKDLQASGVSSTDCLTMFYVSRPSPLNLVSTAAGLDRMQSTFEVKIRFSPHCNCKEFEYRQWICGTVTQFDPVLGVGGTRSLNHLFTTPGGGGLPACPGGGEDGNATLRVGHRRPGYSRNNHRYTDQQGGVDMVNGCNFYLRDSPGYELATGFIDDHIFTFDIYFKGMIIRNGKEIDHKFWRVRGRLRGDGTNAP